MLGFDGGYPTVHLKPNIWRLFVKNCKQSAVKDSIKKHNLLNFVNLSPTFSPRLQRYLKFKKTVKYVSNNYFLLNIILFAPRNKCFCMSKHWDKSTFFALKFKTWGVNTVGLLGWSRVNIIVISRAIMLYTMQRVRKTPSR